MKQIELLSRYRAPLMGIAILMITVFHMPLILPKYIDLAKKSLECGTDIFLLLSGFGLYYSLDNNSDTLSFYKRRAKRIAPSYYIFIPVWFILKSIGSGLSAPLLAKAFIGNISLVGYALGENLQFNWYVQSIFWFYLITPALYALISNCETKERNKRLLFLFIFLVILNISLAGNEHTVISASRLFVFVLGVVLADIRKRKQSFKAALPAAVALMAVGAAMLFVFELFFHNYLRNYGLEWYPFFFIVPGLCFILCYALNFLAKSDLGKKVLGVLSLLGDSSFEIYLIHLFLYRFLNDFFAEFPHYNLLCAAFGAVSVCIGILYKKFINKFIFKKTLKENKNVIHQHP